MFLIIYRQETKMLLIKMISASSFRKYCTNYYTFLPGEAKPDFSSDVENKVFQAVEPKCVKDAKKAANSFNLPSKEKTNASALVNLYTQGCVTKGVVFHAELNRQLRTGTPTSYWRDVERLLNKALDILGEQEFEDLYRGCKITGVNFETGKVYYFKAFLSTSWDENIAKTNFKGTHLFHIKKAKGVNVEKYSRYDYEKEVLIRSSTNYKINNIIKVNGITKIEMTKSNSKGIDADDNGCDSPKRICRRSIGDCGDGAVSGSEIPYIRVNIMVFAIIIYFC